MLDHKDISLMKRSWEQVIYYPESLGFFYDTLFELAPELKSHFPADLKVQREKLSYAIGFIVSNLDRIDQIRDTIEDIGRAHNGMGLKPEAYQHFINALVFTIKNELGEDYKEEIGQAWNRTLSYVISIMVNAPEKNENRFSKFLSKVFRKEMAMK